VLFNLAKFEEFRLGNLPLITLTLTLAAPFLVSVCVAYALFFGGCREHAVFPPIHFIPDKTSVAAVLVWSGIRDCANVAKSFAYPRQTPFPVKLVG